MYTQSATDTLTVLRAISWRMTIETWACASIHRQDTKIYIIDNMLCLPYYPCSTKRTLSWPAIYDGKTLTSRTMYNMHVMVIAYIMTTVCGTRNVLSHIHVLHYRISLNIFFILKKY